MSSHESKHFLSVFQTLRKELGKSGNGTKPELDPDDANLVRNILPRVSYINT
jgi:hypothetical protein